MNWWPIYGLKRRLTERTAYGSPVTVGRIPASRFGRSLFVYVIDVGSSNALNFEIDALESPQYNIHRFGIYMTDSPRHADVLLILGRPVKAMIGPLEETIDQIPRPFGIIVLDDCPDNSARLHYADLPNVIAEFKGVPDPSQLLGILINCLSVNRK